MKWFTLTATLIALAFCATASAYEQNWTGYAHTGANANLGYGYGYGNQLGGSYDIGHHGCCEPRPSGAFSLWNGFCQPKSCGPVHHGFKLFQGPACCPPAPKCCAPQFNFRPIVNNCGCGGFDGCDACRPKHFPVLKSLLRGCGCGCGFKLFGWLHGHGCGCGCDQGADCGCDSGKMHGGYHGEVWSEGDVMESYKPMPTPAEGNGGGEAIPLPPVGDAPMPLDSPATEGGAGDNDPVTPAPTGSAALRNLRSLLGL